MHKTAKLMLAIMAVLALTMSSSFDADAPKANSQAFLKRIGPDPHGPEGYARRSVGNTLQPPDCPAAYGCPDIWELEDGDFAIIGIRKTRELKPLLPATAGVGPDEEIVVIPRQLLLDAKRSIPDR